MMSLSLPPTFPPSHLPSLPISHIKEQGWGRIKLALLVIDFIIRGVYICNIYAFGRQHQELARGPEKSRCNYQKNQAFQHQVEGVECI